LKGDGCPGEHTCTTDTKKGVIAGLQGRTQGWTLENHCHKDRGRGGCPLFDTKPENVPSSLYSAIDTAEDLRELKEINLLPTIEKLTSWEVCCYRVAEAATREVDAEEYAKREKDQQSGSIGDPSLGELDEDSVFSSWD